MGKWVGKLIGRLIILSLIKKISIRFMKVRKLLSDRFGERTGK